MKRKLSQYTLLFCLILGQTAWGTAAAEPNLPSAELNIPAYLPANPEPDANSIPQLQLIPGKLATNWLFQGKKPPQPLVAQEDITFRIERYPWPYTGYFWDHGYWGAGPWFYAPWYRHHYWRYCSNHYWQHYHSDYWRHDWYNHGWGYNDAYTYPLNYVEMQMKLNDNISIFLGVSYISDPVPWP